jgi:phage terminase Nu1 subunit (DNA packaging protein)
VKHRTQSISELAAELEVSHTAIRKAALAGTLSEGVIVGDGNKVSITDASAAAAQWRAQHPKEPANRPDVPDIGVSRARREAALADLAELEVAERRGELIPVEQARADVLDKFAIVRVRILGVPARVAQRLPNLAAEVVPVVDDLLRKALEELADE